MRKNYLIIILTVILGLLIISCEESTSPPQSCETNAEPLDLGDFFALKEPYKATYSVTKSGDASVNIITYVDDDGEYKIENPSLPWEKEVTINSNDTKLSIATSGQSSNGGIESKINATDGNATIKASDSCSHENK